jgi:2'-deoxynucleoside 5'-phosphate N-hydrolase
MKAYIAVSIKNRNIISNVISIITNALSDYGMESLVFVDKYYFAPDEEYIMMQQVMSDIDKCDILIAEVSDKGIGIGVEVGYAKAKEKTILYLRHKDASHSTTVSGMSDYQIIYNDVLDLEFKLRAVIEKLR